METHSSNPVLLQSQSSTTSSSLLLTCFVFLLYSIEIHSQYFDIGESNSSPSALKGEECFLPSVWEGNWFQSGVHQTISINRSIINTKGQCIETDGDKYLFFNSLDNCFRCVVFHEKHRNVLQYKETYCHQSRRSLPSICSTIQADYQLLSMFRLNGVPVPCPFIGSYNVSYNRGHGNCEYPISTLDSCIHSNRFVLNYQACPNVPGTESTIEEIECFASWKESSSRYLLGLIRYHYPASYEERFRCFVYENQTKYYGSTSSSSSLYGRRINNNNNNSSGVDGNSNSNSNNNIIYRLAQSGDATCLGLSPNEGSKTLVLKKAIQSKPCQFPSWLLKHAQWESLNQNLIYAFELNTLRISNYSSSQDKQIDMANNIGFGSTTSTSTTTKALTQAVCTQIIQHSENNISSGKSTSTNTKSNNNKKQNNNNNNSENLTDKITLVLHSTSECQIGFICMNIYKRENHIIELQTGKLSRTAESACHLSNFDPEELPFATFTSPTPESRECPFLTHFDISSLSLFDSINNKNVRRNNHNNVNNCQHRQSSDTNGSGQSTLIMGCNNIDSIELQFHDKCSNQRINEKYTCLGWWEESSGENYLVVSSRNVISSTTANIAKNNTSSLKTNQRHHHYQPSQRFCFTFSETTTLQDQEYTEQQHQLSSLGDSSFGKNQEINNYDQEEEDDEESDDDDDDDDQEKSQLFEQQRQRQNLKRQFQFIRFSESCTRLKRRPQQQPPHHFYNNNKYENNEIINNDDDGRDLVFNATTSFYESSCSHIASSSRSQGHGSTCTKTESTLTIMSLLLFPVLSYYYYYYYLQHTIFSI